MKMTNREYRERRLKAYALGLLASIGDGSEIFAENDVAMNLITGIPTGSVSRYIIESFQIGLKHGVELVNDEVITDENN